MNTDKATPRPWRWTAWGERISIDAAKDNFSGIAFIFPDGEPDKGIPAPHDKANATLIVQAVNAHDELVRACEFAISSICGRGYEHEERFKAEINYLREAVKQAKGE